MSKKTIVFNSFTAANDYNFGTQMTEWLSVFLPTHKTFKGICLAIVGKFLKKKLRILFVFETIL